MDINNKFKKNYKARTVVFILDLDRSEDTVRAARSVINTGRYDTEIMILINGSNDYHRNCINDLLANISSISIYQSKQNLGFAGGNNFLLEKINYEKREYDFVLFLNNDAVLEQDTLSILENCLSANPDVGIAGPRVLKDQTDGIIENDGAKVWKCLMQQSFINSGKRNDNCKNTESFDVPYVPGTCMIIRLELLNRFGGFDGRYFAYFEDWDLCIKIKNSGKRCLHLPGAVVRHLGSLTTEKDSLLYQYLITRNRWLIAKSHLPNSVFIYVFIPYFILSRICYKLIILLFQGKFRGIKGLLMAVFWLISPARLKERFSPIPK